MEYTGLGSSARPAVQHSHDVQFYENEGFLVDAVSRYIVPGVREGHPVIVIATPEHREAFTDRLAREGVDVRHTSRQGLLRMFDARETLATFMDGANPDSELFRQSVGALIQEGRAAREHLPLRAFGEMVDLLWKDGNPEGAIKLEGLWNDLATSHSFSLFCAYAMANFQRDDDASAFEQVCMHHRYVFPTEQFETPDSHAAMLRQISILQQRGRALQTEIAQRKKLERVLRDALEARQEAEAEVRQREQELQDFFENALEGMHWVGADGIILWANQAELDIVGYTREEYVGRHIAHFHEEPEVIADLLVRLQRNDAIQDYESRLRRKDGSFRDVLINSNVLWRGGEFIHTRCITRDITQRKRAEAERDRLLASEQAARQEAELANQLKDQFLATVSHELRTPLTAIVGWTEVAKPQVQNPTVARAFEVIERNANIQLQLVDDLLDASRMISGQLGITRAPVDLSSVVRLAVESIRPKATEKGLELSTSIASVGQIEGDAVRLQQVVGNLLTNAIKFTPKQGHIEVLLERAANEARLTVRDSGEGISADFLPHIFKRFRQAEAGLGRKHDGLGLGLAIVKGLVEAHGGTVSAFSDGPGWGTSFVVHLPLTRSQRVDETQKGSEE